MDLAALRVDARKDRLDGTVLAGRIHALQDQQHRPAVLRIKFFLKILQAFQVGFEDLLGLVLDEFILLIGLVRLEMELTRSVETERLDKGFQLDPERLRRLLAHDLRSSDWLVRTSRYRAPTRGARLVRHCEPTGRANARPMTGSAKQSRFRTVKLDCFVACAPRNDGFKQQHHREKCCSIKAVTKRGIDAVRSLASRTRWIAESSG